MDLETNGYLNVITNPGHKILVLDTLINREILDESG